MQLRRLIPLVAALLVLDTALYSALAPLVPHYTEELGLSKTTVGVVTAAYSFGLAPGALLGLWLAMRLGERGAVLAGTVTLGAATLVFGLVEDPVLLSVLRIVQGLSSGCVWGGALTWLVRASDVETRGEAIGTAFAAAVVGSIGGPVLGIIAGAVGLAPTFAAIGIVIWAMIAWVLSVDPPERAVHDNMLAMIARAPSALGRGAGATLSGAALLGLSNAIIPLRLSELGASDAVVGAAFVASGAVSAVASRGVGRLADRRGARTVVFAGLLATGPLAILMPLAWSVPVGMVFVVLCLGVASTALFGPGMALLVDEAERAGLALLIATTASTVAFALGEAVGPLVGAAIADHTADVVPFCMIAVVMLVAAVLLRRDAGHQLGADAEAIAGAPERV